MKEMYCRYDTAFMIIILYHKRREFRLRLFLINNKANGYGTLRCNNHVYEGFFKNDKKHGIGTYTVNGIFLLIIIAEWKDDNILNVIYQSKN